MKIVCDSCGAKYSIADEKVAGKVFKIRCKRCSEVIVVRGDQDAASAEAQAPAAGADAIWHVVVDGEQQGPMSPAELGAMLAHNTIDWEAFVWTEGFDNWAALRDVEELVAQISGGGGQAEGAVETASPTTTAAGGFGAVASDAFAGEASMGADPFADDEPASAATGSDLFASSASSSPLIGGGAAASSAAAASPRVSAEQAMTGARNENSVLFSLKNLQALATGGTTPSVSPSMSAPGQQMAGMASGEGSGLIDIRALASAAGTGGSASSRRDSDKDELLSLGGQAGGLGALASPLMAPAPDEREGGGKGVLIASILGGAVLVAGGLVAFGMMSRQDPLPAAAVAPVAPIAAAATVSGAQPDPAPEASPTATKAADKADEEDKGQDAKAEEAEKEEDDSADDSSRSAAKARRRKAPSKSSSASSSGSSAASVEPKEAPAKAEPAPRRKPKQSNANSSIDDLLNGALSGGSSPSKPAAAPAPSNLPEKPGRDDVLAAMNAVKSAVSACNQGAGGVAIANITVKGSTGRVTNATIEKQTGAVGSCIAKAVRKAKFPKFQASTFKVKFPFRL